jgi:hypothetical protein
MTGLLGYGINTWSGWTADGIQPKLMLEWEERRFERPTKKGFLRIFYLILTLYFILVKKCSEPLVIFHQIWYNVLVYPRGTLCPFSPLYPLLKKRTNKTKEITICKNFPTFGWPCWNSSEKPIPHPP